MYRLARSAAGFGLLLAGSCNLIGSAGTSEGVPPTSPFVAGAQYPHSMVRLTTGIGEELRQARYVRTPDGLRIALILRNFEQRSEGQCDFHRLLLLDPEVGAATEFDTSAEPIALFVADKRSALAAVELGSSDGSGYAASAVRVVDVVSSVSSFAQEAPIASSIWPIDGDGGHLSGLGIRGVRIVAGLPEVELDYSSGIRLPVGTAPAGQRLGAEPSPDGRTSVSWQVGPDGRGGWTVTYSVWASEAASRPVASWSEPFPGIAGLLPRIVWIDAGHLAWQSFVPMRGPAGDDYWLSRIVSGELSSGIQRVLADHLPRRAGWAVDYAGVFYAVPAAETSSGMQVWEAWVSNASGMTKRLIWSGPAQRVEVCDALDGERVLINRQYLSTAAAEPELRSELIELTIHAPTGGSLALGVEPLPSVPEAEAGPANGAADAAKPSATDSSGTDGEASKSDETAEPEDGGFIPDEPAPEPEPQPAPPAGPGSPPPIAHAAAPQWRA